VGDKNFKPIYEILQENYKRESEGTNVDFEEIMKKFLADKVVLQKKVQEAKERIKELEEQIKVLKKENQAKELMIKELQGQIELLREQKQFELKLKELLKEHIDNNLEIFTEKLYKFLEEALLEFTYAIPQGRIMKEDLKKMLEELVSFRENLKIYINPEDLKFLIDDIKMLKEGLKVEGINLQVFEDESIERGAFKIKGEHFTVERNPKDFARLVFEKVFGNVFKGH